jgi:YbbR domain-containing protein
VTQVFTVTARVIGTPAFGHGQEPAQVTPDQVSVTGTDEAVSRIVQVVVPVDIEGKTSTQQGVRAPVALDDDGNQVEGLTFEPATIQVVVPIKLLFNYRVVPVYVPVEGSPAPGYRVAEIRYDPSNVTICCAPNELEELDLVNTAPVDISGASSTVITTTELILPPNIELYPGQSSVVNVTVVIEPSITQLKLSVAPSVEGLAPGASAVVSPNRLELTLSGTFSQLQGLTPTDVRAVINMEGRAPGTYTLRPQIIVPQGVVVENVSPEQVTVTLIPPTPIPPSPTPTPAIIPTQTVPSGGAATQTAPPVATPTAFVTPEPTLAPTPPSLLESPTSEPGAQPAPTP